MAKQIGSIVEALAPGGNVPDPAGLNIALQRYAELLRPWAEAVSKATVAELAQRDERAWADLGRQIGRNLEQEIRTAPTGQVMQAAIAERVKLITSLPRRASQRVHKLVIESIEDGTRADATKREIMRSGKVSEFDARRIAQTETSSAATAFVEARARHIGSTGYIWRTSRDADVRDSHRKMEGKFVSWDEPPTLDKMTGHAGQFPFCRCSPEVVVPEVIE